MRWKAIHLLTLTAFSSWMSPIDPEADSALMGFIY
jgi:hypothetical protein